MPIRFRCPKCDQLLGIARRKAGAVVVCPKCEMAVSVPKQSLAETKTPVGVGGNGANGNIPVIHPRLADKPLESLPLFERPDFESLLQPTAKPDDAPPPAHRDPAPANGPKMPLAKPVKPAPEPAVASPPSPRTNAIVLTRFTATVVMVLFVVLLGAAFAAGYLVRGR